MSANSETGLPQKALRTVPSTAIDEDLTAVLIKIQAFWDMTPNCWVCVFRRFEKL